MPNHYRTIVSILILILFLTVISVPVNAVKVEGAKIMLDVKPGTTYIFPMAVSIKPDDTASEYAIDIMGFGQSLDGGSYQGLTADKDTGPYSARQYISFPSATIKLRPGERKEFNATVMLPTNIGDGGRYAVVLIHPAAAGAGQASVATAVLVPVMLTVQGSKIVETGQITGVTVGEVIAGKPIVVSTALRNTGNHHFYNAINIVNVTDSSGKKVASVKTEPFSRAVIPGNTVQFDAPLTSGLPVGTYTVVSRMTLENGTLLDEKSTTFTVKEPYVPPFETTSVKVSPDNDAVLAVPGGSITITIPKGAFVADGVVTISPVKDALPQVPKGSTAGTTAFVIDGATGLLAKDATITVKYASGDLAAAGGNAGKLVLARYDRTDSRWSLLPTTVNTSMMTLSATTNRFSTWAVMATDASPSSAQPAGSTTKSPGPEPLLIFGFVGLALLAMGMRKRS